MSLRAKINSAESEGWRTKGIMWRVNGEYCQLMEDARSGLGLRGPKGVGEDGE